MKPSVVKVYLKFSYFKRRGTEETQPLKNGGGGDVHLRPLLMYNVLCLLPFG